MGGISVVRAVGFVMLAACAASAQQREFDSLPDAPSASAQTEIVRTSIVQTSVQTSLRTSLRTSADGFPACAGGTGGAGAEVVDKPARASLTAVYRQEPAPKESGDFFEKYLYPSMLKRNLSYHPSTSSSLIGRASYAASTIFITRDETGKGRLNTPYLVGVLSSAVVHMAYRPYWNRSATQPFSNFGSTIGNDAGMNVLHEFAPGLQQLMKNHAPKFVTRIEQRIGR